MIGYGTFGTNFRVSGLIHNTYTRGEFNREIRSVRSIRSMTTKNTGGTKTMPANPDPQDTSCELPTHTFDDSVELDDPRPSQAWQPSPAQIARWAEQIRRERWARLMRGEEVPA